MQLKEGNNRIRLVDLYIYNYIYNFNNNFTIFI